MSITQAAVRMPEVPVLLDRCRALAALSAICPDQFGEDYVFTPSGDGGRLSIRHESRAIGVHHGTDGTLVWIWDVDESAYEEGVDFLVGQLPEQLVPHLVAMARHGDEGEVWWTLSSAMWRLPGDTAWSATRLPEEPFPYDDRSLFCLADLIDPSPGNLWLPGSFGQENGSFRRADAIRHVLARRPLTEEIVRALRPERGLSDVSEAVAATGHRPAEAPVPLDRGRGEGAPLVAMAQRDHTSACRFLLEPDGEGFHRILLHHSGKAVQVAGDSVGSGVVQCEPGHGDAQKFLIEEYRDGGYHRVDQEPSSPDEGDGDGDGDGEEFIAPALRVTAKQSGLVLHCPAQEGDPVVLVEPRDDPAQMLTAELVYGYGIWGQLPMGIRPPATPYT
ncbi:RICIN domain-containing protein [Streptomyces sp. NPDC096198]|uniref:RICIN domain-containing protein n=1 Tax=Streptomyces sp. NPDC096198 TaxID=3366080 RepID=UPI00382197E6